MYRPFFKQHAYADPSLISRVGKFLDIYPNNDMENLGISVTGTGISSPFCTLMTDCIPDDGLAGHTVYYPRWRYVPTGALGGGDGIERVSNINSVALTQYRAHYRDESISEDDLFYHVYGMLHSQQWRDTFAADLLKLPARIPMARSLADFQAFAEAGRALAQLHVGYEEAALYPLSVRVNMDWDLSRPDAYRIEKLRYAKQGRATDKSRIVYNAGITLEGIPAEAHEYQLGARSALDWLINRYQVGTDRTSGIVNDPNAWAAEHGNPRYILDLLMRVTEVSVRTVRAARALPDLDI